MSTKRAITPTVVALVAGGALLAAPAARSDASDAVTARRPHVVLLAGNSGTETTDLLVPYAVLRDADVAEVAIVAVAAGPVTLMPGLTILPDATIADGVAVPDAVVVPAMHDPASAALVSAVRNWADAGALIVSICDGAWVLAEAGLLDDRAATSHWYAIPRLRRRFPRTTWRQDVRWVRDGRVLTSAGVSAAFPVAEHLVELLRRNRVHADEHAVGAPHDGTRFSVHAADVAVGVRNYLLPWRHESVAVALADGIDELALALRVDLLHRTYAVRTTTFAAAPVRGRRGLRLLPDVASASAPPADRTAAVDGTDVDAELGEIERRYGSATRNLVALQIEYSARRD